STGEMSATVCGEEKGSDSLKDELSRFSPSEVVLPQDIEDDDLISFIREKIGASVSLIDSDEFGCDAGESLCREHFGNGADIENTALTAVGGLLIYLHETQQNSLS